MTNKINQFNEGLLGSGMFMGGLGLIGGPSRNPINPMQNMMQGMGMAQQNRQRQQQMTMQEQFRQAQIKKMEDETLAKQQQAATLEAAIATLPPEDQAQARANPNAFLKPETQAALPSEIVQYQYAAGQGYKGTFQEWKNSNSAAGASKTEINLPADMPYKLEPGFMLKDPDDPSKGVTPIPGGAKDAVSAGDAAKVQMLRTAQEAYAGVEELVYDEDGSPNYTNLTSAAAKIPYSDGRELSVRMEYGIQAITRAETGAAMPDTEVENTRKRFQPSPLDNAKTVKLKLDMFKDFMSGNLKLIDPSGRFMEERFESELTKRSKHDTELSIQDLVDKYKD